MSKIVGLAVVFGVPDSVRQVENLPNDAQKVRLRFRKDKIGRCFVKTSDGVRQFVLYWPSGKRNVGSFGLLLEEARNVTAIKKAG